MAVDANRSARVTLRAVRLPAFILLALLSGLPPELAFAQETREGVAAEQRRARGREARSAEPGRVERLFLTFSDERVLDRLFDPPRGLFVRAGLPTPGAAPAFGPAWRASRADRPYAFTASSAFSLDREWLAEATLTSTDLFHAAGDSRLFGALTISRSGRVASDFWGLGMSSSEADRSVYRTSETWAGGNIGVRLTPWFIVGSMLAWVDPTLRAPVQDGQSITDIFDEPAAPGLRTQPSYVRTEVSLDSDYRDSIPSTRTAKRFDQLPLAGAARGGRYQTKVAWHADRDFDRYSFRQTTVDIQQHVAVLGGHRALSFRAMAVVSEATDGNVVPFYLMPTYGGISVGRGFPTFRYRDQGMLALQAEYRYRINPLMSGALFVDSGQVAPRARDFAWSRQLTTYGAGIRFGNSGGAALRLDVAFGGERVTLVFGMGHAF